MSPDLHTPSRHWLLRRTPTDIPFWIIVFQTVVSLVISPLPQVSLQAVWPHALGLLLYYLLARWPWSERQLHLAWWGLVAAGAALALVGFVGMQEKSQVLFPALQDAVSSLRNSLGPLSAALAGAFHPNVVAGLCLILLPFGGTLALPQAARRKAGRHLEQYLAAAITLFVLTVVLLTQSRAAYMGLAAATLVLIAQLRPRWLLVGLPALGVLVVVGGLVLGWANLADSIISSDPAFGLAWRLDVWRASRLMVSDFCFTGVGFGCFEPVLSLLYPLSLGGSAPHAHNLFLQVAADLGLPGALAYSWLLVQTLWLAIRKPHRELPLMSAAGVSAIAGLGVQGVLDAAIWGNKGAFLPWVILGLILALSSVTGESGAVIMDEGQGTSA